MRALVVHCHPSPESYTAAVRDAVLEELAAAGAETELIDLYADGFAPTLTRAEWQRYEDTAGNAAPVEAHVAALSRCDTLIFVYPTWWYAQPAALKGWLDRVLLPGVAFDLPGPEGGDIRPGLTHVRRLAVFTTCGASWWLTRLVGAPGKRIILSGIRLLCHPRVRTAYAAHYAMDSSTDESRKRHLARVRRTMRGLIRRRGPEPLPARA